MATPPVFSAGAVLTAAQMNAVGLWLIADASFTSSAAVNVSSVFSSDYINYRVLFVIESANSATTRTIKLRFRTSGGDDSTANYYYGSQLSSFGGGTIDQAQGNINQTEAILANYYGYGGSTAGFNCDVFNPQISTKPTFMAGTGFGGNAAAQSVGGLAVQFAANAAHTGFSVYPSTGTITGRYAVYGYRD
jgi:hypothetical protein